MYETIYTVHGHAKVKFSSCGSMRDRCFILKLHTQTAAEFSRSVSLQSYFLPFFPLVQILRHCFDLGSMHLCVHVHALYLSDVFLPLSK